MRDFMKVQHRLFGIGFLFGQREIGVGPVLDVWFASDERIRTILAEPTYWTEPQTEPLDLSKRKMMTAYRQWKKLQTRPEPEIAFTETPELCPQNRTRCIRR